VLIARDPEAIQVQGNRYAERLLRARPGGNLSMSAPPDERPAYRILREGREVPVHELPLHVAAARQAEVRDWDCQIAFADGTSRDLLCYATPLKGEGVGAVGVLVDITARKRFEDELREADRRKSDFLAMLSHELRNPLAPIRNALWILDRVDPGGDQAASAKETIARQLFHLTRMVDDLLDATRISRGKIQLDRAPVELGELVRRTCEDHRTLFTSRGIRLDVEARAPVWLDADPTRVAQAVGNLLSNAAKFSNPCSRVEVAVAGDGSGFAQVRVRDEGVGIPPELLGRVFDAFIQADTSLHRTRGGLGVGLWLVKGLVELHGGSVEARSEGIGLGAEFVIRLPLAPEKRAGGGAERRAEPRMPRRRVLIVEDNVDAAESLRQTLLLCQQEVEVARDGREGVEKARWFRPDIVLCDIGLPIMDGYEVARVIRSDPALRATFLVAVTGYAFREDERRAAAAGFNRHLAKPVPVEIIEEVLATSPRAGLN
jgi:two-component system CheB/CheR fusion protein